MEIFPGVKALCGNMKFWILTGLTDMKLQARTVCRFAVLMCLLPALMQCSWQEELFDLADGTDMVLAVGYDTTTKIIAIEPGLGYMKVYDTGLAATPDPGAVLYAHNCFWFLVNKDLYKWPASKGTSPTSVYTATVSGTIGLSNEGNIIFQDTSTIYSIAEDGTATALSSPASITTFYSELFYGEDGGALILAQSNNYIYRLSSGSVSQYAAASYTPAVVGQVSFLTRVDGELFVGANGRQLYRDLHTNGATFVEAIAQLNVSTAYGAAFHVASSSVWYVAYQENSGSDIVVLRYDNGIPSTVVSIPTSDYAYLFLRPYGGNRLILGVGHYASAKGLYLIDGDNKSYSLISGDYTIYGLSRIQR
jgi:hypothetical protein